MPRPSNVTELKSFLGLVTFYARFLPDLATIAQPLYELTQKDCNFEWLSQHESSFAQIKTEVASDRVLIGYDASLPLVIAVDASPVGLGAVLSHRMPNGEERPIAFASRTLNAAEKRYSQIDKEALAIRWGLFKFHHYLYGVRFTLLTDHQPLTHIFNPAKRLPQLSATRMLHYATELRIFNFDIQYRASKLHGNADCLSRLPLTSESLFSSVPTVAQLDATAVHQLHQFEQLPVTARQVAKATVADPEMQTLLTNIREGKHLGDQDFKFSLLGNVIFHGSRVYVPPQLRKQVLMELHSGHFGVVKMKMLARSYIYWPKLDSDIEQLVRACPHCLQAMKNPPKVSTHTWIPASHPWERLHIDFAEYKKHNLFILVDAYSKWPEVFVMQSQTSAAVIKVLQELFTRFGVPRTIFSDNGPQFTSSEFQHFMQKHNISHRTSAPFHPATNGQAERYVGTVKSALRALITESPSTPIVQHINRFLFAYRRAPHTSTGTSPAERFLGRTLRSALDFLKPDTQKFAETERSLHTRNFAIGEKVAIRNYASPTKPWLVGTVLSADGPVSYTVAVNGTFFRRHVNQMRSVHATMPLTRPLATQWTVLPSPAAPAPGPLPQPPIPVTESPPSPTAVETDAASPQLDVIGPASPGLCVANSPWTPVVPRRSGRERRPPPRFSP